MTSSDRPPTRDRTPHGAADPSASADDAGEAEGFVDFVSWLEPAPAPGGGLARLLGALPANPLARFVEQVVALLDVSREAADTLLTRAISGGVYEPGPFPGVRLFHVEGGPAVAGAITGFVRIAPGSAFPEHTHLGQEQVLVLQGSMLEPGTGRVARPGDLVVESVGTAHAAVARPGPDLVYLAVLRTGLRVGDTELRADDPRL